MGNGTYYGMLGAYGLAGAVILKSLFGGSAQATPQIIETPAPIVQNVQDSRPQNIWPSLEEITNTVMPDLRRVATGNRGWQHNYDAVIEGIPFRIVAHYSPNAGLNRTTLEVENCFTGHLKRYGHNGNQFEDITAGRQVQQQPDTPQYRLNTSWLNVGRNRLTTMPKNLNTRNVLQNIETINGSFVDIDKTNMALEHLGLSPNYSTRISWGRESPTPTLGLQLKARELSFTIGTDGVYGPNTEAFVEAVQRAYGINPVGFFGQNRTEDKFHLGGVLTN